MHHICIDKRICSSVTAVLMSVKGNVDIVTAPWVLMWAWSLLSSHRFWMILENRILPVCVTVYENDEGQDSIHMEILLFHQ